MKIKPEGNQDFKDVEIFEEHEKDLEKEGTISKEELQSKWGVQT